MKKLLIVLFSMIAVLACGSKEVKLPISMAYARAGEDPFLVCHSIADAESKMIDYFFRDEEDEDFDYFLFEDAIHAYPEEAMDYGFERLKELTSIEVFDSDDGNVRIYSWTNPSMATMGDYGCILQYRWKGKVKFGTFIHNRDEYELATRGFYTLEDGLYIRYAYLREWSTQAYAIAETYKLSKDGLEEVFLFETEDGLSEEIDMEYNIPDWYFRAGRGEGFKWIFHYDESNQILYFPSTPEYNIISDRYIPYKWNGKTMLPLSEVGNPFLHPSLRGYEILELLAKTERNIIRVDKIADGNYRYTAWPVAKSMYDSPDIILKNGEYYGEQHQWIFRNQDIEYRISESEVSVLKDKKVLAKWDVLNEF